MAEETLPQSTVNVLARMLPAQGATTTEEALPVGRHQDFTNPDTGKTLTVFSTTGDPRTPADFAQAMAQYEASGGKDAPKGYTVLEPGTWYHKARSAFDAVMSPIQDTGPVWGAKAAQALAPSSLTRLGEQAGLLQPGHTTAMESAARSAGAQTARTALELVKTPGGAALTAAQLALTPTLGAATTASRAGTVVPAIRGLVGNAAIQGVVGGLASNVAEIATGNSPSLREAGANMVIAGASGGIQSVVGGFVGKYIGKGRQEKVVEDVLSDITTKYPNMRANPNILNAYASNAENLTTITTKLSSGLRGSIDDVATTFTDSIGQIGKMNLTVPQQSTLRAQSRRLALAGEEMLNAVELGKTPNVKVTTAYTDVQQEMRDMVANANLNAQNKAALSRQLETSLAQYEAELANVAEGTQLLKYMERAGTGSGWNVNKLADEVRGEPSQPGSLLESVSKRLGFNLPGGLGVGQSAAERRSAAAAQAAQAMLPGHTGMIPAAIQALRNARSPAPNVLGWQKIPGGLAPAVAGTSIAGQDALKDFLRPEGE